MSLVDSAKLELRYLYQSNRVADPAGFMVIPEQGSFDAEVETELFAKQMSLRLRLANLLNQTRYDLIGYPLPKRAFYTTIEARW